VSSGGFEIRGGGTPPPEVLAALAVALTPSADGADAPAPAVPAWTAAALAEGVGGRTAARPSDLTELAPGG
jgi:hypothetical protein